MDQQKVKTEIVQKEKLDIDCSNSHFGWNLEKRKDNLNIDRLEKKLLLDIKYEPIETVSALTLLAFLYYEENKLQKASEYARKSIFVLGISNAQNQWSEDHLLKQVFKKAKCFNNNARRYIAVSVYLHILYKIKDWKAMDEYFKEISTIKRELTDKDQCQIQLIKGYAYKRICPPSEPEALDCFVLAQSFDPDEPEAIFQEAIVREKLRCTEDSFISPLSQEERTALMHVIELWSDRIEYKAYPETLLVTAQLGDKIHQIIELEKLSGTHKLKNRYATNAEREENYLHIKFYAQKINDLYISFQPHFRYVNRAYTACITAVKNLSLIKVEPHIHKKLLELERLIIEKALENHSDDPTLNYKAGSYYQNAYYKDPQRSLDYKNKAKSYFQNCKDSPVENKWAEAWLLQFEQKEEDVKLATVQLLEKYKDSTKTERSGLHLRCAGH